MCRTTHALLSVGICGIQMAVRVFMTIILMVENMIRMLLQTFYNFLSFMLQLLSLIPICCVFLVSSRLKCFMCGGGGPCPVNRGGACDCLMSLFAMIIMFFIFRATGTLDRIFWSIGYAKAVTRLKYVPTTGTITECSRNDTDTEYMFYPFEPETAPVAVEQTDASYDSDYETLFRVTDTDTTDDSAITIGFKANTSPRENDDSIEFQTISFDVGTAPTIKDVEAVETNAPIDENIRRMENAHKNDRRVENAHENDRRVENAHENYRRVENAHENYGRVENAHENDRRVENAHENYGRVENAHENDRRVENAHENDRRVENADENVRLVENKKDQTEQISEERVNDDNMGGPWTTVFYYIA